MRKGSLFDPFTGTELIDEQEKKLFLLSPAYCNMIRKMVIGITSDHRMTVYLLPPVYPELAYTDGSRIMINTLHSLFAAQPIEKITEFCLALAVHESLHPLYSCFQCIQDAATKKGKDTDNVVSVRRELLNILEDARIERIGAYKFPGVAYAITSLNEYLFGIEKDMSQSKEIEIMLQWILDFVSVDKNRGELTGDLGELWKEIKPLAELAKYSDTCSGCYFYTKKIMKMLLPLIPEQDPLERQSQKALSATCNTTDVDAKTGQTAPGAKNGNMNGGKAAHMMVPGNGNAGGQNGSGQGIGGQASQSGASSNSSSGGQSGGAGSGSSSSSGESDLSDRLTNALNSSFKEHIEDIKNEADDRKTASQMRQDSTSEYSIVIKHGTQNDIDRYSQFKALVSPICNQLRKGLKNVINYNVDEMSRYLHTGKIDPKSLSRMPSGAICAKRIEKSDEADLNITLLVDMSGSMSGIMDEAIKACVILQEVCMALKIPISVLGFKSGKPTAIHHFSNRLFKSRYAHMGIVNMSANGGTPLNNALKYLPRLLKKQKEEDKMVIVITDGAPDTSPEECAQSVKVISQSAKVYGLDIGCGGEALVKIFGANCIVVDTLEKLPKELCRVVKRNMLRR